ncbi:hypothetical protein V8E54_009453 [Elaphomyces granulatus]
MKSQTFIQIPDLFKSHRHNPWAHYPKRDPGKKSRIIPHTAGCQHRIPERGIRHCWWHFRQRNLRMGFTLHALTTLRADLLTELSQSDNRSVRTHVPTKRCAFSKRTEMLTEIYLTGKFFHQRHAAILGYLKR